MIAIDQAGSGTPLVLLHGIGASRAIWHRVMPYLPREHLVLTPDLPGFGDSAAVGSGFDLRLTAIALADGLARRTAEPFDLLGNSLGGAVGLALAVERPELVRRLVLAAPAGFSPRPWPLPAAAGLAIGPAMALRRTFGAPVSAIPAARSVLLRGAIAQPGRLPPEEARMMLEASRRSRRIGAALETVLRTDLTGQLRELEAPLGLIWGRLDRVIPISTLESIRALKPAAVVETIADAAHVPQAERPREFVAALRRVLDRLPDTD
jgi:pimeloyl-ACP methyl ester carboxylesterase